MARGRRGREESPTAPSHLAPHVPGRLPNTPSCTPESRARSSAARSTPSARCTKGCSRRRWTPPPRYPDVRYQPQLIDATYALLLETSGEPLVIPALNRDGDCLSDMVLQMFGSIAGSESHGIAFDDGLRGRVRHGRGAARHGAGAAGQKCRQPDGDDPGRGQPAGANVTHPEASRASRAIYEVHPGGGLRRACHRRPGRPQPHR